MDYFDLKVGFTCNNNCVHCVITDKKGTKDLTTQEIKDIISSVPKGKVIGFTGGEATIRPDFIELLTFAKQTGHPTSLQTNGAQFSDWDFAADASKVLDGVLIAIHSHIPEVHTSIVRVPGMYEKTIEGFKNIVALKIPCTTQTVISKLNIKDLPETYDFIQSIKPGIRMNLTFPHPNGNALHNADVVVPRYSEIASIIRRILSKYARLLNVEAIPMCYLYPYQDEVYNFDEHIVVDKRSGIDPANVNNEYFDNKGITNDYSQSMLSEKRKGPKCAQCAFNSRCVGVWKEYVQIHGKHFDLFPVTTSCETSSCECDNEPEEAIVNQDWGSIILYGPGSQCMNSCNFCNGQHPEISDQERFNTAIEEANHFIQQGIRQIEISGGDPGEAPYITHLITHLKNSGVHNIQLSTHGRTLSNERLVEGLKDAGVTAIRIPLYGVTAEVHNKTVQYLPTPGNAFEETVAGIRNVVKYGIPLVGYTLINQHNKTEINKILQFYIDLAGPLLRELYIGLTFISRLEYSYTKDWFLPIKDMRPYLQDVMKNHPKFPETLQRFVILDIPYCVVGEYTDIIENKFMGFPNLGMHKIEETNRSEISDKIPHYRIKSYFEACRTCALQDRCGAIPLNEIKMFGTFGMNGFEGS